ncbi:peptidoglycan-associated lipoprotein [Sphingosinicella soli]|uniref:Peptidoglycan-associated lipoprotein n=2 Tax=Sphingosinicella soli TaxID=333708 RepID=A0A7W7B421_9SPHN|nr:peptidoglycan-associated lipoprotein [Sphingosinicella soli]
MNTALKAAMVAALVATAACSKKTEDLPPPPPPAAPVETPQAPAPAPVTSTVVPGSVEDFMQQAGSDRVFFELDSYQLDSASQATLTKQAGWLAQYANVKVTIEGHADERGTREYNLALGERRANSVKNFLSGQGVAADRISVISYGKERPAVEGSDDSAWAQNRRAVTVLVGAAAS